MELKIFKIYNISLEYDSIKFIIFPKISMKLNFWISLIFNWRSFSFSIMLELQSKSFIRVLFIMNSVRAESNSKFKSSFESWSIIIGFILNFIKIFNNSIEFSMFINILCFIKKAYNASWKIFSINKLSLLCKISIIILWLLISFLIIFSNFLIFSLFSLNDLLFIKDFS